MVGEEERPRRKRGVKENGDGQKDPLCSSAPRLLLLRSSGTAQIL